MRKTRFSPYCLEDGDEYFGDAMADLYVASGSKAGGAPQAPQRAGAPKGLFPTRVKVRGKLRLAGRAVFFDPDDFARPIYMFKFKEVVKAEEYNLELVTEDEASLAAASGSGVFERAASPNAACNFLVFRCATVSTQMVNGEPAAFGSEAHGSVPHVCSFPFGNPGMFLEQLNSLLSVERIADGLRRTQIVQRMVDLQQRQTPFSLTDLQNGADEKILCQQPCSRILPLVTQNGRVVVTTANVYFQPTFPVVTPGIEVLSLQAVRRVERRTVNFVDVGMELATFNDVVYLFAFPKPKLRDDVFHALGSNPVLDRLSVNDLSAMMRKWADGRISTFDYLMFLNWTAGRSLNDLAQYPVLPWVLVDYTSPVLKLDDPKVFRDLSKPIGALNAARLNGFRKRADDLRSIGETPYLYGSHYSNPAYVTFFKVRTHPEYMLVLHTGKLDQSSRIFESIPDTFASVMAGPTDLKELIPEFFYGEGDFLKRSRIDLGTKSDGTKVHRDVVLPPWAGESAAEFVKLNRLALESALCSDAIHAWIDLVFGSKQQGPEAWKADNVFHPHCYESGVKNVHLLEDSRRAAVEAHVREFGQVPKQLFTHGHPRRQWRGATPSAAIRMDSFIPPDSEGLQGDAGRGDVVPQQQQSPGGLPGASPGPSSRKDAAVQRVNEFVASVARAAVEEPATSAAAPKETSASPQPKKSTASSAATGASPATSPVSPSPARHKHVDVVQEALDLGHVLAEAATDEGTGSDSPSQPASGGNRTAESGTDSKGDVVAKLGPQFSLRISTKGRVESVAVCYVPTDADWIFEDYDDGLSVVPIVFASDPAGSISILDGATQKKVRTCTDFGCAIVSVLLATTADQELLVGSLSGTMYVVDLRSCTVDAEHDEVCEAGTTALAVRGDILVTGSKSGCTTVWRCTRGGGGCLTLPKAPLFVSDHIAKVMFVDCDSLRKRVLTATADGTVVVTTIADEDALTFHTPAKFGKVVLFCGFVRDHMLAIVGKYDVSVLTLDGNEWASYPSPVEVAFAGIGRGGALSADAIVIASPEGSIVALSSSNGRTILTGSVDQAQLAGATVTCGYVGQEHIVVGDSSGRVHVVSLLGI